jgi:hypothetical protein
MASCEWYPGWRSEIQAWIREHPEKLPRTWGDLGRFPIVVPRVLRRHSSSSNGSPRSFLDPEAGRIFAHLGPPEPPEGISFPSDVPRPPSADASR